MNSNYYSVEKKSTSNINLQLIFRGNSLFRSNQDGVSVSQYLPIRVKEYFVGKMMSIDFHSFGVGGEEITTINDDFDTLIVPLIDVTKKSILYLTEDANAIGLGLTGAENVTYTNEVITKAFAAGINYIVVMLGWNVREEELPENVAKRQRRQDWYNLVENGALNNKVIIVDGRDLPIIGGGEWQDQDPDYFVDQIHLTSTGYDIVADYGLIPITLNILEH